MKYNFLIFVIVMPLMLGLHILEVKKEQKPRQYQILGLTPAINCDRNRNLYWYRYKDERGRFGQVLSESPAKVGDTVVAKRKAPTYFPGEMIFKPTN